MSKLIDRVLRAVLDCHDGSDLWAHARRDPEAFRAAVRRVLPDEAIVGVGAVEAAEELAQKFVNAPAQPTDPRLTSAITRLYSLPPATIGAADVVLAVEAGKRGRP